MVGTLLVTATTTLATLGGGVGIGTTTISELLTVNGNIHVVSSTAGVVFPDGTKQTTAPATLPLSVANGGTATSAVPSNGQLLIGNGTNYSLNTLTAGTSTVITNTAGNVKISSMGSQSRARAYLGTNQSIPNNAWTSLNLDTINYDGLTEFSTSSHAFTAQASGYYQFVGHAQFADTAVGTMTGVGFLVNGVRYGNLRRAASGSWDELMNVDILYVGAGQSVYLDAFTDRGATTTINANGTWMAIHKLSE